MAMKKKAAKSASVKTVSKKKAPVKKAAPRATRQSAPTKKPAGSARGSATRRLEFTDGGGGKFWEAEVSGSSLVLRWGKLGATGQTKTKDFADADAARAELDEVLTSKLKKGYVEVGGKQTRAPVMTKKIAAPGSAVVKSPAAVERASETAESTSFDEEEIARLASSGTPAAWKRLRAAALCDDEEVRDAVAKALGECGARKGRDAREALSLAETLLKDSCREVRGTMIRALGKFESQESLDRLLTVPDTDDVPSLAQALVQCAAHSLEIGTYLNRLESWFGGRGIHAAHAFDGIEALGPRARSVVPKLKKILKKASASTLSGRWSAIRATAALYFVTLEREYLDGLLEGLGDRRDQAVRSIAKGSLERCREAATPELERLLAEGNALQRLGAQEVLAAYRRADAMRLHPPRPGQKKVPMRRLPKQAPPRRA